MKPGVKCVAAVLMMSPVALGAQNAPELRLTRDLRIDASQHDLSTIGFITVSPNGSMFVSQPQDGLLRIFDARGALQGTFGRKGRGPGEFDDLVRNRNGWIRDTLWISDFATRRFTLIAPDRTLIRTVPFVQTVNVPAASGMPRITSVQAHSLLAGGHQLATVNLADDSPWPGGKRSVQPFVRVDTSGAVQDVIAWHPGRASCLVSARSGNAFMTAVIPYCATPLDDVSQDGSRYAIATVAGDGGTYRVLVMRTTGDTISARTFTYAPVRIPQSVADSVIQRRIGRQTGPFADMWRSAKIPASYPPLNRLVLGRDETTWLEKYTVSGEREWTVLDGKGNAVASIVVPRNTHLAVASRDQVWAIETDEDGIQHVVRYRVR